MVNPLAVIGGINAAASVAGTVGSFMGGGSEGLSRQDQRYLAHHNLEMSRDALYRNMQIRAADAEKAGFHPLAALGVMPSGSPAIPIPGGSSGPRLGDRLERMGQNVSRAIQAYQTPEQRAILQAELDNAKRQGNLIDAQVAESKARTAQMTGTPPPAPPSGDIRNPKPKYVAYRNQDGTISYHYNPEFAASIMSDPMQMWAQSYRNLGRSSETGGFPWQGTWNELKAAGKRLLNPIDTMRDWRR